MIQSSILKNILSNKYLIISVVFFISVGSAFFYGKSIESEAKELEISAIKTEYENKSLEKENEVLKWKQEAEKIKTVEVIKWRDRKVYIEKKAEKVEEEIKDGALKDEKNSCNIGPNFIRLHNDSAS